MVIYAMGGAMNITDLPEREPLRLALNLMVYQGGTMAATATMAGVLAAPVAPLPSSAPCTTIGTPPWRRI